MTVTRPKTLDDIADAAVREVIGKEWAQSQLANCLRDMVSTALQLAGESGSAIQADPSDIDDQGWIDESWAAWRLVLRTGDNPAVVFFSRQPTYAERKAFAAAAKVPVADALVEERPQ